MDTIKNDRQLDELAAEYAQEIWDEIAQYDGEASDLAHQYADGCQHVIYYHAAHELCRNCNTDNGAAFLEDCGTTGDDYDDMAVKLAFGEIYTRIMMAFDEICADAGDPMAGDEEEDEQPELVEGVHYLKAEREAGSDWMLKITTPRKDWPSNWQDLLLMVDGNLIKQGAK